VHHAGVSKPLGADIEDLVIDRAAADAARAPEGRQIYQW